MTSFKKVDPQKPHPKGVLDRERANLSRSAAAPSRKTGLGEQKANEACYGMSGSTVSPYGGQPQDGVRNGFLNPTSQIAPQKRGLSKTPL